MQIFADSLGKSAFVRIVRAMASENEVRSRSDSAPVPTSGFSDALSGVWQSAWWNDFLVRTGWARSGAFVESSDGSGRVSARFELRSVGLGLTGMFSVGGPETSGNPGTSAWKDFSKNARREAEIAGAAFVQIEPLSENPGIPGFSGGEYRHFLEKRTLLIDLSQSEESILGQMKEKGRYNVRLAEKRGVSVRMAEPTEENVAEFLRLLRETLERDGFSGNSSGYYLELVRTLDAENAGGLFFAEKGGEVVAAAITTFWKGTATYYYGASTSDNEKRRDMPAYLLQWEMMRE